MIDRRAAKTFAAWLLTMFGLCAYACGLNPQPEDPGLHASARGPDGAAVVQGTGGQGAYSPPLGSPMGDADLIVSTDAGKEKTDAAVETIDAAADGTTQDVSDARADREGALQRD